MAAGGPGPVLGLSLAAGARLELPVDLYISVERAREQSGRAPRDPREAEALQVRHKLVFDCVNEELARVAGAHRHALAHLRALRAAADARARAEAQAAAGTEGASDGGEGASAAASAAAAALPALLSAHQQQQQQQQQQQLTAAAPAAVGGAGDGSGGGGGSGSGAVAAADGFGLSGGAARMAEDLSRRFAAALRAALRGMSRSVEPTFADDAGGVAARVDGLVRGELQRTGDELLPVVGSGGAGAAIAGAGAAAGAAVGAPGVAGVGSDLEAVFREIVVEQLADELLAEAVNDMVAAVAAEEEGRDAAGAEAAAAALAPPAAPAARVVVDEADVDVEEVEEELEEEDAY